MTLFQPPIYLSYILIAQIITEGPLNINTECKETLLSDEISENSNANGLSQISSNHKLHYSFLFINVARISRSLGRILKSYNSEVA